MPDSHEEKKIKEGFGFIGGHRQEVKKTGLRLNFHCQILRDAVILCGYPQMLG